MSTLSPPRPAVPSPEEPDPAWVLCSGCRAVLSAARLERALWVCPDCHRHQPLTAGQRLSSLLDPGSIRLLDLHVHPSDPLDFTDTRPYLDRWRASRQATGLDEAVLCARGRINTIPVLVAAMDFRFMGGSLGSAVGEAITLTAEIALRERSPLVIATASGGARMQEGIVSLLQMAKTAQAIRRLDEAGLLTVCLVTDPTFGGVAASFATLCDVIIAEPGARLGFAGPRVIRQTIGEELPNGFQTAEFLREHGLIDLVVERELLRQKIGQLIDVTTGDREPDATGLPALPGPALITDPDDLPEREIWETVRTARRLGRPTTLDYLALAADHFIELHGDRLGADCPAMVSGLGRLGGLAVAVIGTQKGHTGPELAARNYGMPTPAGYRKAARVIRLAAKLGLPVVTLIDTAGAYPGVEAEQHGQSIAIAENLRLLSGVPVPVVALVTGEGGSGGALALGIADRVLICANAIYSVISPEGCAAILWNDPAAAPRAAAALRVDARSLLQLGVVDAVVPEPVGGADADHHGAAGRVHRALDESLRELRDLDRGDLLAERHQRFRRYGSAAVTLLEAVPVPRDLRIGDTPIERAERTAG
jgi:acetyl-CoA carboxylase carboxyl transferase beta subunit/acetyl-CoA carboxylase carboxyl transferase alpha subunit